MRLTLTISDSVFVGNKLGVSVDQSNDFAGYLNNRFDFTGGNYGLESSGADAVISGNYFTGANTASGDVSGARSLVSNNVFNAVRTGLAIHSSQYVPADRITARDNTYYNITDIAIPVSNNGLITGNTVTHAATGISGTGEFRNNVVSLSTNGISASPGSIVVDNRSFNNTGIGLLLAGSTTNSGNRLYNNNVGIHMDFGSAGSITNNIVYNNSSAGIQISGAYPGDTPTIANNTIIQSTGSAIYVSDGRSQNVIVKNNIIQVSGGYAIKVDPEASRGFSSDYNVINVTGTGQIGRWENADFNDPADWFYKVGLDQHSKFTDPQFVNLAGNDGMLGFADSLGTGLTANYYAESLESNGEVFDNPVATRTVASLNFDAGSGSPLAGVPANYYSIRHDGFVYIPTPGTYTFYERASDGMRLYLGDVGQTLSTTATIDQWTYDNYNQYTAAKTFATSGWVPIRIDYHKTTGGSRLYLGWSGPGFAQQDIATRYLSPTLIAAPTDFGMDDNFAIAAGSPAIDAGNPNDLYYREPGPNGGRVNAGAIGNTASAQPSSL